jgi:phenylacetate-CoA ligase
MSVLATLLDAAPRYAALIRSQYWTPEKLGAYRDAQLRKTLAAAAGIPFYAERLGRNPRIEEFRQLPVLQRPEVELLNRQVRSLRAPGTHFIYERSSGTSGAAVELLLDRSHQRGRYAARARYLRACGWNPFVRTAWFPSAGFLAGHLDDPDTQFSTRLFIGTRFIANSTPFPELAAIVRRLNPSFMYIYPTDLDGLLQTLEERQERIPGLRRLLSGGEVVDDSLRDRARRQLGVEITDNYGSSEAFLAWQCLRGNYHVNAEHVIIEVVDQAGREVAPGEMGRVLITTLENYLMPLLRYEIGDYAIAAGGPCPCGRTLPLLGRILGRQMNLFRMPDGTLRSTLALVNVVKELPQLKQFQIVQKTVDRLLLRYAAARPLHPEGEDRVRAGFRDYLGSHVSVGFEQAGEISRAPGGKFMVTLSEVPR